LVVTDHPRRSLLELQNSNEILILLALLLVLLLLSFDVDALLKADLERCWDVGWVGGWVGGGMFDG
jgi:hypothetical protein